MNLNSFINYLLVALLFQGLTGCAVVVSPPPPPMSVFPLQAEKEGLKIGDIIETRTGRVLSADELFRQISGARIVYVGETHTSAEDHRVQEEVLKGLLEEKRPVTVALEMLPRETQSALDRFMAGVTTEEEFLKESDWEHVWGYPFQLYRNIFMRAREQHLRMLALNAPPSVVRKISHEGLASLSPAERHRIADEFIMNSPRHRAVIREQFDQHSGGFKNFESFYEAQLAWEETMAETLAKALSSLRKDETILVFAGKGHVSHGLGVPYLTAKRAEHRYVVISPMPIDAPESLTDPELGDFVRITDRDPMPFHRPRLGVMIHALPGGKGLEVLRVLPESPADTAGIKTGDVITAINTQPVKSIEDLHQAVSQQNKVHRIDIRRGSRSLSVTVTLPSP